MKSFDRELKRYSEKVTLKISERRELRERILSYMEYHPLPKQTSLRESFNRRMFSQRFARVHLNHLQMRLVGGALVLLLIFIPIFAERSVPGEVLYILKTNLNEKIQGQLADSSYEKIEFETKLLERRIAEARFLASEGKLTEETTNQLEKTVKGHADAVRAELTELRGQDADGAAIAEIVFNSSLEVQSTILDVTEEQKGTHLLDDIIGVVKTAREEGAQNQELNKPSYIGLVAQLERQTTRAYELFEIIKDTATEEEITDIERRLSDIHRLFEEAKEENEIDGETAVESLTQVLGQVQKLITFMSNLDVRESVTLERLVPVVLSTAERTEIVREEILKLKDLLAEIELSGTTTTTATTTSTTSSLVEGANGGLTRLNELVVTAETALEVDGDVNSAEAVLFEAKELARQLGIVIPEGTPEEEGEIEGDAEGQVMGESQEDAIGGAVGKTATGTEDGVPQNEGTSTTSVESNPQSASSTTELEVISGDVFQATLESKLTLY